MTLNPKAVEGANLRILAIAKASVGEEYEILRSLGVRFPQVNVISVREQLESAASLFDRLTLAVRRAAAVAALAGLLVLSGLALNLFWGRRRPKLVPVPEQSAP